MQMSILRALFPRSMLSVRLAYMRTLRSDPPPVAALSAAVCLLDGLVMICRAVWLDVIGFVVNSVRFSMQVG